MARFNEMQVGRYNRMVQKLLSMKGQASLVTIADEAIAVFPLFYGAENRYLEGWDRFGFTAFLAGVALNQGGVRLRNPAGANAIAVVELLLISEPAADSPGVALGTATADLANVTGSGPIDTRGRTASSVVASSQTSAPTVPGLTGQFTLARPFIAGNQVVYVVNDEDQEIPLLPGSAIQINANTVNQAISVSFIWRERYLEDSERA